MRVGYAVITLPILLGGCLPVLPPVVSAISTAMTGASIVMHGKTGSDQVLSVAVNQNCAMYRVAIGEAMCREFEEGERAPEATLVNHFPGDSDDNVSASEETETPMNVVLAEKGVPFDLGSKQGSVTAQTEVDEDPIQVSTLVSNLVGTVPIPQPRTVTIAGIVAEADRLHATPMPITPVAFASIETTVHDDREPAATTSKAQGAAPVFTYSWTPSTPAQAGVVKSTASVESVASASERTGHSMAPAGNYVVLGSFQSADRAERLASEHRALDTLIIRAEVADTVWHRVAVGPLSEGDAKELEYLLEGKLARTPWTLRTSEPVPTTVAQLD